MRWGLAVAALFATVAASAAEGVAPDSFTQRMRPCMACHGDQGRATPDGFYPRIAGKPAGYLFEQLLNFRDGRRQHAEMAYLLDRQPDAYLRAMANHFASLHLPYAPPAPTESNAAELARGEALVRHGDPAKKLPSCAACHGERLTGIEPAVPGLLGLPHDYLVAQIGSWREHARRARAPDCMADIARQMQPEDIGAVAAWLAAQPVPEPSSPRQQPLTEAPMRCGSLEPRR